jgi:hypothetical protein
MNEEPIPSLVALVRERFEIKRTSARRRQIDTEIADLVRPLSDEERERAFDLAFREAGIERTFGPRRPLNCQRRRSASGAMCG